MRAGPVTALLDGAFLRRIRVGPHEVLRGVYAAVRDQNWGTVEPTFSRYELEAGADSFRLRFTAEHRRGEIDFAWDGEYVGEPERADRVPLRRRLPDERSARTASASACSTRPSWPGTPYVRQTPAGPIEERFPERISPRRDVTDIEALRYAGRSGRGRAALRGRPLRHGGPAQLDRRLVQDLLHAARAPLPGPGGGRQRISQTVTLDLRVPPDGGRQRGTSTARRRWTGSWTVGLGRSGRCRRSASARPSTASRCRPRRIERLRALRPAHLRVELDLRSAGWRDVLRVAAADAAALGASLDVAVVTDEAGTGIEDARRRRSRRPGARWCASRRSAERGG